MPFKPRTAPATSHSMELYLLGAGWGLRDDGWHHPDLELPWSLEQAYRLTRESAEMSRSLSASCAAWRATAKSAKEAGR